MVQPELKNKTENVPVDWKIPGGDRGCVCVFNDIIQMKCILEA